MRGILTPFVLALAARLTGAQSPAPSCTDSDLNWSFNSDGLTPCQITVALGALCANGQFTLPAIGPGFFYSATNSSTATLCRCSTVFYSTLSACAACQNATFLSWPNYNVGCAAVYSQKFPDPLPPNVKVPHWAYLDIAATGTFDLVAAQAAGGTESSAVPSQSQTSSSAPSSTSGVKEGSGGGANASAIAGGVVGGVVFLALVAGLVFWYLRRQRLAGPKGAIDHTVGYNEKTYVPSTLVTSTTAVPTPKPYNPDDPSTFPTNNPGYGAFYGSTPASDSQPNVATPTTAATLKPFAPTRPQYTGVPEI